LLLYLWNLFSCGGFKRRSGFQLSKMEMQKLS